MRIYEQYEKAELAKLGLGGKLPKHIGIIMDGNGRWATKRLMPRPVGHSAGMEALQIPDYQTFVHFLTKFFEALPARKDHAVLRAYFDRRGIIALETVAGTF